MEKPKRKVKLYQLQKVAIYPHQCGAIEVTVKEIGFRRIIRKKPK